MLQGSRKPVGFTSTRVHEQLHFPVCTQHHPYLWHTRRGQTPSPYCTGVFLSSAGGVAAAQPPLCTAHWCKMATRDSRSTEQLFAELGRDAPPSTCLGFGCCHGGKLRYPFTFRLLAFGLEISPQRSSLADCSCHLSAAESFPSFHLCTDVQW